MIRSRNKNYPNFAKIAFQSGPGGITNIVFFFRVIIAPAVEAFVFDNEIMTVGRVNVNALHLSRIIGEQCFQGFEVVALDEEGAAARDLRVLK
jgi:hypothetical protein